MFILINDRPYLYYVNGVSYMNPYTRHHVLSYILCLMHHYLLFSQTLPKPKNKTVVAY